MESRKHSAATYKVLMFPYLAHGHISPFLELAKKLTLFNFNTYICSTPVNLTSIKNRITKKQSKSIHLLELNVPSLPDLPPHYHTTNGLPLHLKPTLERALKMAKPEFESILETLRPDLLIHDCLTAWSHESASERNIPSLIFSIFGALTFSYFGHLISCPEIEFPFPNIRLTEFETSLIRKIVEAREYDEEEDRKQSDEGKREIVLMNSSTELEGKYIDYACEVLKWKIIPVGTLVQGQIDDADHDEEEEDDDDTKAIMDWLEEKDDDATLYISFGSECFLSREEIEEVAYGLMTSDVSFLWVIRSPKGEEGSANEFLPQGFVENTRNRGKILERFAPQVKILSHRSVVGFVSHCGWNSLIESINCGVPIIAMPIQYDQPINAKLVVELGVAIEVSRDDRSGKFQRGEIARVFEDVVVGERGEALRRRVGVLREKIAAVSEQQLENVAKVLVEALGNV